MGVRNGPPCCLNPQTIAGEGGTSEVIPDRVKRGRMGPLAGGIGEESVTGDRRRRSKRFDILQSDRARGKTIQADADDVEVERHFT
jgi:hypothetical protein